MLLEGKVSGTILFNSWYACSAPREHVPIDFNERRLGKDIEVVLELLERLDNCSSAIWAPQLGRERHNILGLLRLRFVLQLASSDLDVGDVLGEERQDVDERVLEQLTSRVLGKSPAEMGLVLAIWFQQFPHGRLGVLRDVLDHAGQGHWEGGRSARCHPERRMVRSGPRKIGR